MKFAFAVFAIFFWLATLAQTTQTPTQIRQQMAKIRQSTNWDDPAAAKKANEEIKKLAQQLSGVKPTFNFNSNTSSTKQEPANIMAIEIDKEMVHKIANRFFLRSYIKLNAVAKNRFDIEFEKAEKANFDSKSIRKISSTGAYILQFGDDTDEACVFLAAAVKTNPSDTLAVNNFGAFLRNIDSTRTALTIHLYANKLCSQSSIILTQIGCSYFELKDYKKAEDYLKEALKYNPGLGAANSALCELYIQSGRWKTALHQLWSAVVSGGFSYNQAHGSFATIKNAAKTSSSGNASLSSNVYNSKSSNTSSDADFWSENNLGIKPEDMLSALDPQANIPDNEKLAPLVPPDYHLEMPDFPTVSKLEDWTHGGGFNGAVNGYQSYMATLKSFNVEFQKVNQSTPNVSPNATVREYSNERFAIDCILEYFRQQSKKEYKAYSEKVDGLPEQASKFVMDYFEKHEKYRQELETSLQNNHNIYLGCQQQCEGYPIGSQAREVCFQNCAESRKFRDSESHRKYCLLDCNAANDCNRFMNGIYDQYNLLFADHKRKQEELLDDLYEFTDKWLAKIYSPYWSKIYVYEINREALGIIGNVYISYQQAFMATVISDCGTNCSDYVIQPPAPVGRLITKAMMGNECPFEGNKISLGIGFCGVDFDCESIEGGCSAGVSISLKRNFKNKSSSVFVGAGVELKLGSASGELKSGVVITQYDNGDMDIGGKIEATGKYLGQGKNIEMSATMLEGAKIEAKNVFGF